MPLTSEQRELVAAFDRAEAGDKNALDVLENYATYDEHGQLWWSPGAFDLLVDAWCEIEKDNADVSAAVLPS